jgi:hypothetical protein
MQSKKLQLSSSGFQLIMAKALPPRFVQHLSKDKNPEHTHGVDVRHNFACGLFNGKL